MGERPGEGVFFSYFLAPSVFKIGFSRRLSVCVCVTRVIPILAFCVSLPRERERGDGWRSHDAQMRTKRGWNCFKHHLVTKAICQIREKERINTDPTEMNRRLNLSSLIVSTRVYVLPCFSGKFILHQVMFIIRPWLYVLSLSLFPRINCRAAD